MVKQIHFSLVIADRAVEFTPMYFNFSITIYQIEYLCHSKQKYQLFFLLALHYEIRLIQEYIFICQDVGCLYLMSLLIQTTLSLVLDMGFEKADAPLIQSTVL